MNDPARSIRVLHVNDVASVGSAVVAEARSQGLPWRLWPLPQVRGLPLALKAQRRLQDLGAFRPAGRSADVLHIHYGLFAYYAWSVRRPYLLHLHGTDVRQNLNHPALRSLVRRAIRRAGQVVYSTPDLGAAVRGIRSDAIWLPAPLSPEVCAPGAMVDRPEPWAPISSRPLRVVFASRWDAFKGLDVLLDIAGELNRGGTIGGSGIDLIGVDWGSGAGAAASAGVRLRPRLAPAAFRALLGGADIVIGQQRSGALGVADLEAMALGRPLVARFDQQQAYGDAPEIWNTAEIDPIAAVRRIVADPTSAAQRAAQARDWALAHHGPERCVRDLLERYAAVAPVAVGRPRESRS